MLSRLIVLILCFIVFGCQDEPSTAVIDNPSIPNSSVVWSTQGPYGIQAKPGDRPTIAHVNIVDLNQDGRNEVLVCDVLNKQVSVIESFDNGTVQERSILDNVNAPVHAEASDLDGDGDFDILVAAMGVILPSTAYSGQIFLLENDGSGQFESHLVADGTDRVTDVRAGDLDSDGDIDLAVAQFGYTQGKVRWYENLGNWNFEPHTLIDRSGAIHSPIVDLDGDGDLDIVALLSQEWETVVGFINDGDGSFMPIILHDVADADFSSSGICISDLDSDGDADIVWANGDAFIAIDYRPLPTHGLQWLENKGNLEFDYHRIGQMDGVYSPIAVDFDVDGDIDILTVSEFAFWDNPDSVSLRLWSQENDGSFTPYDLAHQPTHLVTCDVGDLDGNGQLDIVAGGMALYPPFNNITRVSSWMNPLNTNLPADKQPKTRQHDLVSGILESGEKAMVLHANGLDPRHLYLEAIASNPENPKWHYLLGLVDLHAGESEKALRNFENAYQINSNYAPLLTRLGELYAGQGDSVLATRFFNTANTEYALISLAKMQISNEEWTIARSTLSGLTSTHAELLIQLIDSRESGNNIEIAQALDMGYQMLDEWKAEMESKCVSAPLLVTQAQTAIIARDNVKAEALLRKAIQINPKDKDARLAIATLLIEPNRLTSESLKESIRHLEEGLKIDPHYVMTRSKYAWALYLAKQNDLARNVWLSILNDEPMHGPSLTNLAQLELQLGNYQSAYEYYKKSFAIPVDSPFAVSNSKALNSAIQYRFGLAAKRIGKIGEAERAFRSAIELVPLDGEAIFQLGNLYIGQKRFEEALPLLNVAREIKPENSMLLAAIGYTQLHLGDLNGALSSLESSVQLDPKVAISWYHLATAQSASNQINEAKESLKMALQLQPNFQAAEVLLNQLRN